MGNLELQFEKPHLGTTVDLGIVTRIRQTLDASGKFPDQPFEKDVVIPVGTTLKRAIEVPDGSYRIEARLPSGEILREDRTITPGQDTVDVVLKSGQSPREWLSLQRLAGNVPTQDEYQAWLKGLAEEITEAAAKKEIIPGGSLEIDPELLSKAAAFLRGLHLRLKPTIDYVSSATSKIADQISGVDQEAEKQKRREIEQQIALKPDFRIVEREIDANKSVWDALASPTEWALWEDKASPTTDCVIEKEEEDTITLWKILQDGKGRPLSTNVRRFAISRREQGVDVISIPAPWPLNGNLHPPPFEVLRESGTSSKGKTTLTVCDAEVGGLLLYLNNGKMAEASAVLAATSEELIENMIAEKQRNPFAACAAAYVGLATLSANASPRWVDWLTNVNNLFRWLPDGAVVHAMYLMKTAKSRTDLDAVADLFVAAYERGVPYYSAGVQQLLQGLYVFRSRDKKIDEMYRKVSSVALRLDPDQVFTVVAIPSSPT